MGGGGGFSPIPVITSLIFGGPEAALTTMALGALGGSGQKQGSGEAEAAAGVRAAEAERAAREAETLAEQGRREQRRRQEAQLLDQARGARRAELAGQEARAQTLGAPVVETSQLKEKLGQ